MTLDELLEIIQRTPGRSAINLQPEQRRILETFEGPLWVIAGPGSGKTEILVLRCLRLLYVDRVDPKSVMVTTFTEKAARELQDRLTDYAAWITESAPKEEVEGVDVTHVRVGTLHSICNEVLLEYRYPPYQNVRLMDGLEQLIFINEHSELARTKPEPNSPERQLWTEFVGLMGGFPNQTAATRMRWPLNRARGVRDLVGRIVEYRVDVRRLAEEGGYWACLAEGYQDYVNKLQELRRSDFSHVQKTFLEFLGDPKGQLFMHGDEAGDHPGVRHVLVDEYQDTNPIQEAIYFRLTEREPRNLMVVGDDDQAIYRFRGGTVEALIYFDQSCEDKWAVDAGSIEPVPLYDNFRSHHRIVDWCNHYVTSFPLMQQTGARAPGKMPLNSRSSINHDHGNYPSVAVISGPRPPDVARVFALTVRELVDSGTVTDPSDCALLLRSVRETRNWAGPYVQALRSQGIETYNPRAKTFLNQEEVQAALGALLAVLDPGLAACPNQVSRHPQKWNAAYQAVLPPAPELGDYVTRARAQIASKGPGELLNTGTMELFYIVLSFPPFSVWQQDIERSTRLAKLTRIIEAYTSMPRPGEPERTRTLLATSRDGHEVSRGWLGRFYWGLVSVLEQEGLDDEEDEYEIFPRGRLPIMTIFQAKGLQFPFVFVATREGDSPAPSGAHIAEDLLYPFRADALPQKFDAAARAIQDHARLFYVAHSRAQHGLIILATDRQRSGEAPHLGPGGLEWINSNGGPDLTLLPVSSLMRYATPFSRIHGARRTTYTPRRRYSVTADVLSFRRCRRQYGNEAVHGYQPSRTSQVFYGTVIHQVLDRAHAHYHGLIDPETGGTFPTDEDIERYFDEVRQSLRTRGIRGARLAVEEQALRVLQIFNRVEGETLYPRVVDSEHRMQADEDTYVLHGTVDLLANPEDPSDDPEALEIWDYKGQRRPKPNDERLQDYRFQMMVYADLYRRRHDVYPLRARLYFLNELDQERSMNKNREEALVTVEFTEQEVQQALGEFRRSVSDIEACRLEDEWQAPAVGHGPGEETCTICDFRWNCPTVRDDSVLSNKIPMRYP